MSIVSYICKPPTIVHSFTGFLSDLYEARPCTARRYLGGHMERINPHLLTSTQEGIDASHFAIYVSGVHKKFRAELTPGTYLQAEYHT